MCRVERDTSGLKKNAQLKSAQTFLRANKAIDAMVAANEIINFKRVAERANVSKAWLYKQESIASRIKELRGDDSEDLADADTAASEASLNSIIATLKLRIDQLNSDNAILANVNKNQTEDIRDLKAKAQELSEQLGAVNKENHRLSEELERSKERDGLSVKTIRVLSEEATEKGEKIWELGTEVEILKCDLMERDEKLYELQKKTNTPQVDTRGADTQELLLSKLPDFPVGAWKEVQLRWFAVYEKLINEDSGLGQAPQLPPYDPEWSEEAKGDWFKIYRDLVEGQQSTFRCEDIMQIVNVDKP